MASTSAPVPALAWLPNGLTILRFLLIPAFIVVYASADNGHSWAAGIIFGVAGITDQVDGWLARRWHVESEFGKYADPLADRLMIDAAVIMLVLADRLPWPALAIILARDLFLIVGAKVVVPRGYDFSVSFLGKCATWLLYARHRVPARHGPGHGLATVALLDRPRDGRRRGRAVHVGGPRRDQEGERSVKAVVMAGGEGTRLRPLTSNQPKPMVPIVGKPCMEHILELLGRHGFDDVIVTLAFMPQAIRSYFGDGESLGLNIEYSVEESPLGTAGSVRLASGKLDDTVLVISGDALCDIDLGELLAFHREKEAAVTIGLKSVENPLEFGIVVTDEDGRIERFLEKPSWGQVFSDTINTGIYVIEPEVLKHVPTDRPYDFSKELFPLLLEMGRPLYGKVCDGYWQDIGNLDEYRQANFDALDGHVALNIPGLRLRGNIWIGEGVEIDDLEDVEGPAFIGNYCRISPQASIGPYSVLSASVTLRERARTVALRDRREHARRPQLARRGRDHRPRLRHPLARPHPGGRRDRGRGRARRAEPGIPGRADLPVQGGRVRRTHPREPDLGVARHLGALRQGRRHRPDRRRPDPGRGRPPRRRSRHGAEARRARRRQPRVAARLPHDQAGDDHRPERDRSGRRRPARPAAGGQPPHDEDAGLRRRHPRRRQPERPRAYPRSASSSSPASR